MRDLINETVSADDQLAVIAGDGTVFSVERVEREVNAEGGATVWLHIEEL